MSDKYNIPPGYTVSSTDIPGEFSYALLREPSRKEILKVTLPLGDDVFSYKFTDTIKALFCQFARLDAGLPEPSAAEEPEDPASSEPAPLKPKRLEVPEPEGEWDMTTSVGFGSLDFSFRFSTEDESGYMLSRISDLNQALQESTFGFLGAVLRDAELPKGSTDGEE